MQLAICIRPTAVSHHGQHVVVFINTHLGDMAHVTEIVQPNLSRRMWLNWTCLPAVVVIIHRSRRSLDNQVKELSLDEIQSVFLQIWFSF